MEYKFQKRDRQYPIYPQLTPTNHLLPLIKLDTSSLMYKIACFLILFSRSKAPSSLTLLPLCSIFCLLIASPTKLWIPLKYLSLAFCPLVFFLSLAKPTFFFLIFGSWESLTLLSLLVVVPLGEIEALGVIGLKLVWEPFNWSILGIGKIVSLDLSALVFFFCLNTFL